jgi:hypothetical protein
MTKISGFAPVIVVVASVASAALGAEQRIDFQGDAVGTMPKGFAFAVTGPGAKERWEIREDATSPNGDRVLVQASDDKTRARFPLAIYDALRFADGAVAVRFKAISGEIDQAAGLVWRYRDPNNYYIVRANALEGNVVLYKVENGKRSDLKPVGAGVFAYGKEAHVLKGTWQELRVEFTAKRFRVFLDGRPLFEVEDDTFAEAGRVGLWTKADSVTAFDGLVIAPAP